MEIRAEEISQVIRGQIKDYDKKVEVSETGVVLSVGDGRCARLRRREGHGLGDARVSRGIYGLCLNLEEDNVGVAIMGDDTGIREGDVVKRTGRIAEIPVGDGVLGRVIDAVGNPLDGKGPINTTETRRIEMVAPGVIARQPVSEPMYTGLKAIDAMTPIGRGQRELVIGDRQIGKTAVCVDSILNQKNTDIYCIYVAIGQKKSTVAQVVDVLERNGAMEYTTVVAACASDPATQQYLAPYSGCSIGEYYRDNGKHALIIYDDLSKQATAYRQVSLLLRRPPGREAFPGDIFYNHSAFSSAPPSSTTSSERGLSRPFPSSRPRPETWSAYIPTNVISITDGQVYLEPNLFFSGVRPAINVGLSVSRVGGAAQTKAMRKVAGTLRVDMAQFRELEAFAQFGSDLDKATQRQLNRGRRLVEVLKQGQYQPMDGEREVVILFAGANGFLDEIPEASVLDYEAQMLEFMDSKYAELLQEIKDKGDISDELKDKLIKALEEFKDIFQPAA